MSQHVARRKTIAPNRTVHPNTRRNVNTDFSERTGGCMSMDNCSLPIAFAMNNSPSVLDQKRYNLNLANPHRFIIVRSDTLPLVRSYNVRLDDFSVRQQWYNLCRIRLN